MRLPLGDDPDAEVRQLVHDPADRDLVAGDDPRREDDRVALAELELVRAAGDPAERGARLALPAGGDDQHFARAAAASPRRSRSAAGNPADSRSPGRRAGCGRASGRRCTPCGRSRSPTRPIVCSRAAFEAKVVTSTRPLASATLAQQPAWTLSSEPDGLSWKTLVESHTSASTPSSPIARQRLGARRLADHRRLVDLPVAGVEDVAERRFDQQRRCLPESSATARRS